MAAQPTIPWMDELLAQQDLSKLVLGWLDAESLLALRLVERRGPGLVGAVFNVAEAAERLRRYNTPIARRLFMSQMVEFGHLRLLQYARTGRHPMPWSDHVVAVAARQGHTHILYWMYFEANPPVRAPYALADAFSCAGRRANWGIESEAAAEAGRLDVIKWLRKHYFPLTPNVCYIAASGGHVDILKHTVAIADPETRWLRRWLPDVHRLRADMVMDSSSSEHFRTAYRERLEQLGWLRVLQWYFPFGDAAERVWMLELAPREWLEEV
jgi:hypothetical protein